MKCIIIDDEPLAIDVIESYLLQIGGIEIIAKCTNPLDAITMLSKNQVDLVFLDIQMPNLTGIDLVKTVHNIPQFIFTTAYPQYAIDAFNLNATDYLVKPIPFQRFLKAVSKAKEKHELEHHQDRPNVVAANPQESAPVNDFIFVKSEYENIKIGVNNIKYVQGLKDYIKLYVKDSNKPVLTLSNFKVIQEKLPNYFIRVHRSFIVNINYIRAVQKTKIVIDDVRIPIGETYKNEVLERLGII